MRRMIALYCSLTVKKPDPKNSTTSRTMMIWMMKKLLRKASESACVPGSSAAGGSGAGGPRRRLQLVGFLFAHLSINYGPVLVVRWRIGGGRGRLGALQQFQAGGVGVENPGGLVLAQRPPSCPGSMRNLAKSGFCAMTCSDCTMACCALAANLLGLGIGLGQEFGGLRCRLRT